MSNMADPPYVLLIVGLLAGITSCSAFVATLKQLLKEWSKHHSSRTLANLRGMQLIIPFIGISLGICIFLASCLQIFAFSFKVAYGFSVPLTLLMAGLVWFQLTQLLNQLERKGFRGIDLDDWTVGKVIPQPNPKEK